MTEHPILITWLNDYVFCPKSIFFHNLYSIYMAMQNMKNLI